MLLINLLVNIDTSTMRIGDIETYKMSSFKLIIYFKERRLNKIWKCSYSVNISKSGSRKNLTFNTSIKATLAQTGTSKNDNRIIKKKCQWNLIIKNTTYKNNLQNLKEQLAKYFNGAPTYPEFEIQLVIYLIHLIKSSAAQSKLMDFFHDALNQTIQKIENSGQMRIEGC